MAEIATAVELDGQYRALREEAGYLPRARAALTVRGADGAEYLQGQLTNDIEALERGQGCYAALLDRKGHLQADMRVLRLEDEEIWVDLEPGPAPAVLKHLRTYSIGRDVEVEDVSDRWAITSLIGPRARELAGFEGLAPEHAQGFRDWDGIEVLAVATDVGLDLVTRADAAARLARTARGRRRRGGERTSSRDHPRRVGQAAVRTRHGPRVDARRGRHHRASRELREGLLHRPGTGGAAALPRQAEPDAPWAPPQRCGRARHAPPPRRQGGGHDRQHQPLPRLRPDRPGDRQTRGRGGRPACGWRRRHRPPRSSVCPSLHRPLGASASARVPRFG